MAFLHQHLIHLFLGCVIALFVWLYFLKAAMYTNDDILGVANGLLKTQGLEAVSSNTLQRLWAGYGHICEIEAKEIASTVSKGKKQSLILKYVTPPTDSRKAQDEGHLRKIISYQVEQYFYSQLAPKMPPELAVATCLASINEQNQSQSTIAMVLTDLRRPFPVAGETRGELSEKQTYAALTWLARFHGFWWERRAELRDGNLRLPPLDEAKLSPSNGSCRSGVWLNGGYTYLATRRKEYASLQADRDSEWSEALCKPIAPGSKSIAKLVAQVLSPSVSADASSATADFETLIHGDVKSENLFTTSDESAVAFYDFQYVGLGLGVSDLAKLFTVSVPLELLMDSRQIPDLLEMNSGERKLLETYQTIVQDSYGKQYPWEVLELHWNTALIDWLRFQASWGFWGNTGWLEARARSILKDEKWRSWLHDATHTSS